LIYGSLTVGKSISATDVASTLTIGTVSTASTTSSTIYGNLNIGTGTNVGILTVGISGSTSTSLIYGSLTVGKSISATDVASVLTIGTTLTASTTSSTIYGNLNIGTGTNGGYLTVGISGSTSTSTIYGSLTVSATVTTGSDYRIKENIQLIYTDIYSIDDLNPLIYYNKNSKKNEFGFLAHEVQENFPFLVTGEKDGEEIQTMNYIGLIALLTKEIQELKKRVAVLEK
jgi:hypothetical protein